MFQLVWRIRGQGRTADVAGTTQRDNARTGHVAACPPADVLGIM
jgi:hypothetical protein